MPMTLPVGHRIGKLTVIGAAESVDRWPRVTCRCDCGVEKAYRVGNLTKPKPTLSCAALPVGGGFNVASGMGAPARG